MQAPKVVGIWVKGGGKVTCHGNTFHLSSGNAGAIVRGFMATNGGTISSDNDDVAAMVMAHSTLPDAHMTPKIAGIWVEGAGSAFNGNSSKIHLASDVAGATVFGGVAIDDGTISGTNNNISASVSSAG